MKFSELFEIARTDADDWFDVILSTDTRIFVDPFQIYADVSGEDVWNGAHQHLLDFFNLALKLLARSGLTPTSSHWRAAERLLMFPEPPEFCMGYSDSGTEGSGSAEGLRADILDGATNAIRRGITSVRHFEELTLFSRGIAADRIGDIACNVLKERFIAYTQKVVKAYSIPTARLAVPHASWSYDLIRWEDRAVDLPVNPYTGNGLLLVPERFLRHLPTVNSDEFWAYAWSQEGEQLRDEFNYDIARNVDGGEIARLARRHPDLASAYVADLEENPKPPYDLEKDPLDVVKWYDDGAAIASRYAAPGTVGNAAEFAAFVRHLVDVFKHSVEYEGAWEVLHSDDRKPRSERIVQKVFYSVVSHYCRANNIDLSPETNVGRGPVDFKFSHGWESRALIEMKLTNNSHFWHGLTVQTPMYQAAAEVDYAIFVAIGLRDTDFETERTQRVRATAASVSEQTGRVVTAVIIDARPKLSASQS